MLDTASIPTAPPTDAGTDVRSAPEPRTGAIRTGAIRTGAIRTGAIRTLGSNPATAPIMLHPGDAISNARRVVYIVLLGALTALGPFTVDLYLPAFPVLEADFQTTAAAIQLTLTGTMLGFALGQLIVGPLSDKVGRRIPLLSVTALHVVASTAAALAPTLIMLGAARVFMGMGAAAGGVVAMAIVRDLFGGRRLVVMLSRLALVSGVAPVIAPLIGSALLAVMPWRGIFVVLAIYGGLMLTFSLFLLPETLPKARRGGGPGTSVLQRYRSVLSDRVFIGVLIVGAMSFSGLFSYLSSSSFLFQVTFGFDAQQYGLLFAVNSLGVVGGVQVASRLAARFGPQWVMAYSTGLMLVASTAIIVLDQLGAGIWGVIVPLFVFVTAFGFTMPCVQVLALDRHGKAAGTAASLIGATNFGVAALISPIVGSIARDAGITASTMAVVMVGCGVVGVTALWAVVRPRTIGLLTP
ncbi:multidrug effflux MFS transporter [uncultured Microbacterium sp.]|uniref:multidrug effflux MFS transporter n=1 Tax=uncultured Microbacterium sp. TaxID=191216 RepID=UPI0035CAE9B7